MGVEIQRNLLDKMLMKGNSEGARQAGIALVIL